MAAQLSAQDLARTKATAFTVLMQFKPKAGCSGQHDGAGWAMNQYMESLTIVAKHDHDARLKVIDYLRIKLSRDNDTKLELSEFSFQLFEWQVVGQRVKRTLSPNVYKCG